MHMRRRRDGRELSLPGERRQTAYEIWARRSGHFSMPATALHRSESYLSVPWHLSMPRVGPWKAPRHDPASRARRPLSHRSIFTLLRSFGSENFLELGPSARVRILGIRNHGFFTRPLHLWFFLASGAAVRACAVDEVSGAPLRGLQSKEAPRAPGISLAKQGWALPAAAVRARRANRTSNSLLYSSKPIGAAQTTHQ